MTWEGPYWVTLDEEAHDISVTVWDDTYVVLAYRRPGGEVNTKYADSMLTSGELTGWSSEIATGATTSQEPELVIMHVDSSRFGVSKVLGLFILPVPGGYYEWRYADSPGGPWTAAGSLRMRHMDLRIQGNQSPAIVAIDAGTQSKNCGAFTYISDEVFFLCYDKSVDRWSTIPAYTLYPGEPGHPPQTSAKPGIAFHKFRFASGAPLPGNEGQFYVSFVDRVQYHVSGPWFDIPMVMVSNAINPYVPDIPSVAVFEHWGHMGSHWTDIAEWTGVDLYEDDSITALKALWLQANPTPGLEPLEHLQFLPLADGTFDTDLDGVSDFKVMERGICLGIENYEACHVTHDPGVVCCGLEAPAGTTSVWGY
jgi:hypothetical protein